jgi:uncharacterized damage-inducible protein DinB
MDRYRLVLDPVADDPEIGRWLAALDEVRRDTLKVLNDIPVDSIDRALGDGGDTVGTVLYHIALIEADWVFSDVLDREADIPRDLFPFDAREAGGHLSPIAGQTMTQHLERIAQTRAMVVDELRSMSPEDFHRARARDDYDVSAAWVVFHLIDHEVEHRVRLVALRDAFRRPTRAQRPKATERTRVARPA